MIAFDGFQALDDVAVDAGAETEIDGGADERSASGLDALVALDEVVEGSDGAADALLQLQCGVRKGFLAEPAAEAAFADLGLAGGGGDRARGEQGFDGTFLRWR